MNESTFKIKVIGFLKTLPKCWFFKVWGGGLQRAGIPDIIGCLNGRFFALELKSDTGKPTRLQEYVLNLISKANGFVMIVYPEDYGKMVSALKKVAKSVTREKDKAEV
jgi:hypothetical protein